MCSENSAPSGPAAGTLCDAMIERQEDKKPHLKLSLLVKLQGFSTPIGFLK
jgi:hypothetical protein